MGEWRNQISQSGMECREISPEAAAHLFAGWDETIIWSCLQKVMGRIYADDAENPTAAMAVLGDFGFLAGKADMEFLHYFKTEVCKRDFMILVPQNEAWGNAIEACYGHNCRKVMRYAFRKEKDAFDVPKLEKLAGGLPEGYRITMMDERWFSVCKETEWCRDLVAQYESYDQYARCGLGVLILKDEIPVSGASSYSGYRNGIEIEIDTREDVRRKGLATVCGAELILECLRKNWYPSWDAQNLWSAALAEKLGYRFSHEYAAYEVSAK